MRATHWLDERTLIEVVSRVELEYAGYARKQALLLAVQVVDNAVVLVVTCHRCRRRRLFVYDLVVVDGLWRFSVVFYFNLMRIEEKNKQKHRRLT